MGARHIQTAVAALHGLHIAKIYNEPYYKAIRLNKENL